jgi:hypothetical protein
MVESRLPGVTDRPCDQCPRDWLRPGDTPPALDDVLHPLGRLLSVLVHIIFGTATDFSDFISRN